MHAWLAVANLPSFSSAYNDVASVYPYWLTLAREGSILGIDAPWVYPIAAWLPVAAAGVAGPELLPKLWIGLVVVLNGTALAMLQSLKRGMPLAWTWLCLLLALGPVALGRIDTIAVAIAIMGLAASWSKRSWLAGAAFTLGAWMKVWPGVLWLTQLIAERRRLATISAGTVVTAVVLGVASALGAGAHALSFLFWQNARGLQIEAVVATPLHWMGVPLGFDDEQLTYQLQGALAEQVAAVMTPLLIAVVLVIATLGIVAVRRGVRSEHLAPWLSLSFAAALIVCNSVGSPQFMLWLVPSALMLAMRDEWWTVAGIAALSAATQLIYPWAYVEILGQSPIGILLLSLRNLGTLVLLVWAISRLGALTVHGARRRRSTRQRARSR